MPPSHLAFEQYKYNFKKNKDTLLILSGIGKRGRAGEARIPLKLCCAS